MAWILLGALAAATFAAPPAGAATFCVADPTCVSGGGTAEPDVQAALDAARALAGADTVEIGPGTYSSANGFDATDASWPLTVRGAGRDQTTLAATADGRIALTFGASADATVTDLTAVAPRNGVGVFVPQHVARVAITGGTGFATGLWTQSTDVQDVVIALPLDGSDNIGLYRPNGTLTADGLTIAAHTGIDGFGTADAYRHVRIVSDGTGISLAGSGTTMTIDDAQIRMSGGGVGISWALSFGSDGTLRARFVTLLGDGTAGSIGVRSASSTAGARADVTLEDSIVTAFDHALGCAESSGATATLTARYSAFDPSDPADGCGAIDTSTGDISADPELLPDANGDLQLAATSPAIDAGDPGLTAPDPATDLAGDARLVDGDGDGTARVDMGAFEHAAPPPPADTPPVAPLPAGDGGGVGGSGTSTTPPPVQLAVTRFRIIPRRFAPAPLGARTAARRGPHRGATFRFALSRDARVTVRVLRLRRGRRALVRRTLPSGVLRAGDRMLRFDGRDNHGRPLAPGRYRATIVARAGSERATAKSVRFTILAP